MALQYYSNKAWGSRTTVTDLTTFAGVPGAWAHQDVARFNARILEYYADLNTDDVLGAPAAEAANGYHAYLEGDGVKVNGVTALCEQEASNVLLIACHCYLSIMLRISSSASARRL